MYYEVDSLKFSEYESPLQDIPTPGFSTPDCSTMNSSLSDHYGTEKSGFEMSRL